MTKKKPHSHNIGGSYRQKRRKENKGKEVQKSANS